VQPEDYPALFRAADSASVQAQAALLLSYKVYIILLVIGSILALFGNSHALTAGAALLLFIASLVVYLYRFHQGWHDKWYRARALAESIKTATWRYMLKAEPFASNVDAENAHAFRQLLSELLKQNEGLAKLLSDPGQDLSQITAGMKARLVRNFQEAKDGYLHERVQDQLDWYLKKCRFNRNAGRRALVWVVGAYAAAMVLLTYNIANPGTQFLPIEALAVLASGIIGWSELRRFNELESAYALTAHEVSIIQSQAAEVTTLDELASFVSDAENAFSREHTQWAARRDH